MPAKKLPHKLGRGGHGLKDLYQFMEPLGSAHIAIAYQLSKLTTGMVHMSREAPIAAGLAPIDTTPADHGLANAIALANALRGSLLAHLTAVGSETADAPHLAADNTGHTALAAVPAAHNLSTLETLANELQTVINAHLARSGVHFHDDGTTGDATTAASDLPTSVALVNAMATFIEAHYERYNPAAAPFIAGP